VGDHEAMSREIAGETKEDVINLAIHLSETSDMALINALVDSITRSWSSDIGSLRLRDLKEPGEGSTSSARERRSVPLTDKERRLPKHDHRLVSNHKRDTPEELGHGRGFVPIG
jgi:hypothetical protein